MTTQRILTIVWVTMIGTFLIGCEKPNEAEYEEQIVLQGLMYIDNPLQIRLSRTVPKGESYSSSEVAVHDARVYIVIGPDTAELYEVTDPPYGDYRAEHYTWWNPCLMYA